MSAHAGPPTQFLDVRESVFPDSVLVDECAVASSGPNEEGEGDFGHSLLVDTLVYVAIAGVVAGVWWLSQQRWFESGDDRGYWIGVVGALMMLMLFSYPVRKYLGLARTWGPVRVWLWVHMVLGVGGPALILLHSNFEVRSLNAGVAFYCMVAVALSGVAGRFLYARINRGLWREKVGLEELQRRAGLQRADTRSRLAFSPKVEARLRRFEARYLNPPRTWPSHLLMVLWMPLQQLWVYWRACRDLRRAMRPFASMFGWSAAEQQRRQRNARRLVWLYLLAVSRVGQYAAYDRLFSLWHVLHVPVVYVMVMSVLVHVFAVHAY